MGTGVQQVNDANTMTAQGFNQTSYSSALLNGDYFQFTVSPGANVVSLSFSAINANLYRTTNGPESAAWSWSRDNYAAPLASTNSISTNAGGAPLAISSFPTNGITTSTTFRLVVSRDIGVSSGNFGISATGGTNQNPSLTGSVVMRSASTLTWDGELGNGSWNASDATNETANWNGYQTPLNGDTLVFAGTTQTNTTNNVSSLLANAIVFSNTAGTFAISGNALTVSNGITNLSANGQTFSNQITLGAAQTFNASAGNLTLAGNLINSGNRLTVDGSSNTAVSGAISGAGGLTKTGTGTLSLSGANSYSGGTVVSDGKLIGDTRSLQGAITNNASVIFDQATNGTYAGAVSGTGALTKSGAGTVTLTGANTPGGGTLIASGALAIGNNGTSGSLSGLITNNGALVFNRSDNITQSDTISGTGTVIKRGSGTMTLAGTHSYSGGTVVEAGMLVSDTTSLQGAITNNASVAFAQATNGTYAGAISGSGSLVKSGAGELTLSASNSYSGGTSLNEGLLRAGNVFAFGSGSVTLTNGATLDLANFSAANTFINNGGTLTNAGTITGAQLNAGTTTLDANNSTVAAVTGTATLNVEGNNTTITNMTGGTLNAAAGTAVNSYTGGNINISNATAVTIQSGNSSGAISGAGGLVKTTSGELTLSGANSYSGGTVVSDGKLTGDTRSLQGAITNQATLAFDQTTNGTFGGAVSGAGVLTKSGAGTVTLTGANTPVGGTLISAGALAIGNNGTTGSLSGLITNNGALLFNRSDNITQSSTISGTGTVIKSGSGTMTLAGTHSYSGGTVVEAGMLVSDTTSLQGAITNNASVAFAQATNGTYAGAISGSGSLVKNSAGTLTLSGTSSYSGTTTVSGGAMVVNGAVNNSLVTVESGAMLGGSGSVGGLHIKSGGTISPGNSPGTLTVLDNTTWDAYGNYNWQVYDATGGAGTGWDLVNIGGSLDLSGLSATNKFNINLWSLSGVGPDVNGNALNFTAPTNRGVLYSWTILNAGGGITGFDATNFNINVGAVNGTGGFLNPLGEGTFFLEQNGNNLDLKFGIIPEPGTWAAAALLAGGAAFVRWRKRSSAE